MFTFLTTMMAQKSGATPFTLTGCTITKQSTGTSCGSPATWKVDWTYSGDATGKTVTVYEDVDGNGSQVAVSGVSASLGTYTYNSQSYGTQNPTKTFTVDVTDDSDSGNTVQTTGFSKAFVCL